MRVLLLFLLSLGHLVTDLSQGALPMLLPVLREEFRLSYTEVGVVVLVANLSASVTQPLFGLWSDRYAGRWLLPLGCFLSALGMALAGAAPGYALVLLGVLLSGLGSAAYHPEGSKQTFLISGTREKATALSVYSVGGNIGFGLGPLAAACLLAWAGRFGVVVLLVPALATSLLVQGFFPALARLTQGEARGTGGGQSPGAALGAGRELNPAAVPARVPPGGPGRAARAALLLLVLIVTLRSWVHVGVTTFIPLYYVDCLGSEPGFASMLLTIFLLAGAAGTLLGGPLADRWGKKTLLLLSFCLVVPPLLYLPSSTGAWSAVLVGWSGLALISTFAVTVVYAQELIPNQVGLASGLILGFAVGMGGLGALLLGSAADLWGVPAALKLVAVLPLPALFLTFLLPDQKKPESGSPGSSGVPASRTPLPGEEMEL